MCTPSPTKWRGAVPKIKLLGIGSESVANTVVCATAGPLAIGHKEPAGHPFHDAQLKQNGLFRE